MGTGRTEGEQDGMGTLASKRDAGIGGLFLGVAQLVETMPIAGGFTAEQDEIFNFGFAI